MKSLLIALAVLALGAATAALAQMPGDQGMVMVGNQNEMPNLAKAGEANVARARKLLRQTRRASRRFETLADARRLGYAPSRPLFRPGISHLRSIHARYTGSAIDPQAPSALLFWCPSHGRCTLVGFMYRAPAGPPPSTWGDLLGWHRHRQTGSWMTHVWLVRDVREALATCAPIAALARDRGITPEPYMHGATSHVLACTGDAPTDMPMP